MEARSREIAPEQWKQFFDETSRHYFGRQVDLLWFEVGEHPHALATRMPFIGCTFESDGSEMPALVVRAGNSTSNNPKLVTHVVRAPRHVWMRQVANGGDNAMRIESDDGSSLVIEFSAVGDLENQTVFQK